ncbi:neck protein [Rhizobium phage RHph_I1_18]|nr:neck protein [Rhizobium phage RHph_I1_18]
MSKYKPASRVEFIGVCRRNLGGSSTSSDTSDGILQLNVTDDQIEDCVEEGLKYFRDYHFDGSQHVYYAHQISQQDITNRYITVPETLFGVTDVYDYRRRGLYGLSSTDMFSFEYQMLHQTANMLEQGSILSYYVNRTAYETVSSIIGNQSPLRFNRHTNKVYIDSDWSRYNVGEYIILDGYQALDPDVYTDIWADRWLIKYVTAKIKYRWGGNLSKFEGMQLPGGVTLSGQNMQDDALTEIQQLEDEMMTNYSIPARDVIA